MYVELPSLAQTPVLEPIDTPFLARLEVLENEFTRLPRVGSMKPWQRETAICYLHQLLATVALLFTQLPSHKAQNEILWALASAVPCDTEETLVVDFLREQLCA